MREISKTELHELIRESESSKREWLNWEEHREIDGLYYSIWKDDRTAMLYCVREPRSVHMGFNDSPTEKIAEVVAIVEREGMCKASWGVTGRTMHAILAEQLREKLPQYKFDIGYNYHCLITK